MSERLCHAAAPFEAARRVLILPDYMAHQQDRTCTKVGTSFRYMVADHRNERVAFTLRGEHMVDCKL
jgi:hypothetical protein